MASPQKIWLKHVVRMVGDRIGASWRSDRPRWHSPRHTPIAFAPGRLCHLHIVNRIADDNGVSARSMPVSSQHSVTIAGCGLEGQSSAVRETMKCGVKPWVSRMCIEPAAGLSRHGADQHVFARGQRLDHRA